MSEKFNIEMILQENITSTMENIRKEFKSVGESATAAMGDIKGFQQNILESIGSIVNAGGSFGTLKDGIRGAIENMMEAGLNLKDLKSNIDNMSGSAISAAGQLAQLGAQTAVEKTIKFAVQTGEFMSAVETVRNTKLKDIVAKISVPGLLPLAAGLLSTSKNAQTLEQKFSKAKTTSDTLGGSLEKILQNTANAATTYSGLITALNTLYSTQTKVTFTVSADTAAKGINTTVTFGQTMATKGATIAAQGLSTAMLAIPFVGVISAIVSVVGALGDLFSGTANTSEATKKLNEDLEEVRENLAQSESNFADSLLEAKANAEMASVEVDNLMDLYDEYMNGEVAESVFSQEVQELIDKYPQLEGAIQKVNGEWRINNDLIEQSIENIQRSAEAEAYRQQLVELYKEKSRIEENSLERNHNQSLIDGLEHELKLEKGTLLGLTEDQISINPMIPNEVKEALKAAKVYDEEWGTVNDKIQMVSDNYTALSNEEIQEEMENEYDPAVYGNKHIDEYNASVGEVYQEAAPDLERLTGFLKTLGKENVTEEDKANIATQMQQYGYADIDPEKAGDAEYLAKVVAEALQDKEQETAQEATKAGDEIFQSLEDEIEALRTLKNETDDEELAGQIEEKIAHLTLEKDAIEQDLAEQGEAFQTAMEGSTTAIGEFAKKVTSYEPVVHVDLTVKGGATTAPWQNQQGPRISPAGYASGTSFYPGGVTTINEQGDELVELPTGAKIYPARESGRMYQQLTGGNYNISISDIVIREEADIDRIITQLVEKLERARRNMR